MRRRHFTKSLSGVFALSPLIKLPISYTKPYPFQLSLSAGSIGVSASIVELIPLANQYGYDVIVPQPDLFDLSKVDKSALKLAMDNYGIGWGSVVLPVEFRKDEATFQKDIKALPQKLDTYSSLGVDKVNTWIMPANDLYPYLENFDLHVERLSQVANIAGHHDMRFGIEYVGPKTLMASYRYPFISSLKEAKQLIEAVGEENMGLVLDSFHWYCSEESVSDLLNLDQKDIVTVDLNDAVASLGPRGQIDNTRHLPGSTGVIDITSFLDTLERIGYKGPVRAEPFNKVLNDMDNEEAIEKTAIAMKKVLGRS